MVVECGPVRWDPWVVECQPRSNSNIEQTGAVGADSRHWSRQSSLEQTVVIGADGRRGADGRHWSGRTSLEQTDVVGATSRGHSGHFVSKSSARSHGFDDAKSRRQRSASPEKTSSERTSAT